MNSTIRNVAFRVDASIEIGTGHVMRCLTLADKLREANVKCKFICRTHEGNLIDLIVDKGFEVISLSGENSNQIYTNHLKHACWLGVDWETDATQTSQALKLEEIDWLVVDHYAIDSRWENLVRPYCSKLMVIDDLADRPHDCDLLLDQNLGRDIKDYENLLSPSVQKLIGPKYAILRPDFAKFRPQSLARRQSGSLKSLLITMGGVDKDNATGQILRELREFQFPEDFLITVVMGSKAPWINDVQGQAKLMNCPTQVLIDVKNMAQLMADFDLAIGAVGGTTWERCCLGVPTIAIVLADNQKSGAKELQKAGAAKVIDNISEIKSVLVELLEQDSGAKVLAGLSSAASKIVDGNGAEKVITQMMVNHA